MPSKVFVVRDRTCLDCQHEWTAPVVMSATTANLSGEATTFCPKCGSRSVMSGSQYEVEKTWVETHGLRYVLRTDGTVEHVDKPLSMQEWQQRIGAEGLDVVNLRNARKQVMLVDDGGYDVQAVEIEKGHVELRPIAARKPINVEATKLYHSVCKPGTTHQIVGDVAVVPDDDYE